MTRGALLLFACLIAACATEPPQRPELPEPPAVPEPTLEQQRAARSARLDAIGEWRARGKVAFRLPGDAGSASLDWNQQSEQSRLRLSGPLGVGSTQISNEGALLRVRRDGIDRLYPADGAPWLPGGALLPIPVESIQFWLRGLPDPTQVAERLDYDGVTIAELHQRGWIVTYEDYKDVQGLPMPSRMALEAPAAGLSLKLIVRSWDLGDVPSTGETTTP